MIERPVACAVLVVGMFCAACRTKPADGISSAAADSSASRAVTYNVITAQELADANLLGSTADIAVQRLRPAYLIDKTAGAGRRTQPIMVSVNGGQLSGLNALNAIPASTIAEIRYFTVGEASQRFRQRTNGPVILVTMMSR
jgi:hypothetical protein